MTSRKNRNVKVRSKKHFKKHLKKHSKKIKKNKKQKFRTRRVKYQGGDSNARINNHLEKLKNHIEEQLVNIKESRAGQFTKGIANLINKVQQPTPDEINDEIIKIIEKIEELKKKKGVDIEKITEKYNNQINTLNNAKEELLNNAKEELLKNKKKSVSQKDINNLSRQIRTNPEYPQNRLIRKSRPANPKFSYNRM